MPEFFVARDRARRIGWHLEKILQERRLAWRGADIGMASIQDDAETTMASIAEDARRSIASVLAGEIRDRERGFMEIPLVVALTTVARRVERAVDLEARRRRGRLPDEQARRRVVEELGAAMQRLEAYQAAYDEKAPVADLRPTDLAHLLTTVAPETGRPWDQAPPLLVTEPNAFGDLLLAIRTALGEEAGAWHVVPSEPGRPLELGLGSLEGEADVVEVPAEIARAADVLSFRQPVTVEVRGEGPVGIVVRIGDAAGESLATVVAAATGGEGRLSADAQRAVHTLSAASPMTEGAPLAPDRLVALAGLLQVLDREVLALFQARLDRPRIRLAAGALPREATRKAPLRKALLEDLESRFPGLPVHRLGDLATALVRRKLEARKVDSGDAAVLLAAFGREAGAGGVRLTRGLEIPHLADDAIEATVRDLLDIVVGRRALESGGDPEPLAITRLECAAVAVLGRLGLVRKADPPPP